MAAPDKQSALDYINQMFPTGLAHLSLVPFLGFFFKIIESMWIFLKNLIHEGEFCSFWLLEVGM